jgi:translation initiation factor IF-2
MTRKRVHELSKEWNLPTAELIARLEKLGARNKKAQSMLADEEVEKLRADLGLDRPAVAIGDEKVTTGNEGQTVIERRVGTNVIRRRTAKSESSLLDVLPMGDIGGPLPGLMEPLDALPISEPLPEVGLPLPMPEPETEMPAPDLPLHGLGPQASASMDAVPPEIAPPPPPPPPVAPVRPATQVGGPPPSPAEGSMRGPIVLGKIDLRTVQPPTPSVSTRERTGRDRGATLGRDLPSAIPAPTPVADDDKPRKRKRKVISKPEAPELSDMDRRRGRLPRKKRALPGKELKKTEITTPRASKRIIRISEVITVGELAKGMGVKAGEVIKKLMDAGMMASINQVLDHDTATLIAGEFEYTVENVAFDADSMLEEKQEATTGEEALESRPPVVTIMGHVDHGKTSLLDAIRETNVTAQEAGGITQHIGAYSVDVHGRRVTFLDTPGHEAFTAMRARGARVTDIVVLVVAADDGVMPQTIEAINHARAAEVPILVAINKIDKPEANLERIKQGLADYGLVSEDWGGDTICVPVSAKTKEGIANLLEMLLLQADVLELKANPDKLARGAIVEAKLDRGRGPVATVLVQEGTLKIGDPFVCGGNYGRVRAMIDDKGRKVDVAGPSTPVEILGLQGVPDAGSPFVAVADEATARQVAEHRRGKQREADLVKTAKVSLEDLYNQIQAGDVKELRVVIKADVQGSVEALSEALSRLSTDEVRLNVLHASVGGITESDVLLASASNAVVLGFNVRPESKANDAAEREGVDLRLYTIIYDAVNDVRDAMEGLLEPTTREKTIGKAEVRQVFTIPSIGTIAGSFVTEGKVIRNASVRLVRDHVVVHTGKIISLRRFKEDAREVTSGYECGIGLENYQDIKSGDVIEAFEIEQVARRLSPATGRSVSAERRA